MRHSTCRGLTLTEVLVAIGCTGLLLALATPAIVMAREVARRTACMNNFHQLGVSLHAHEAAKHFFPRGGQRISSNNNLVALAPHVYLLPYLDQSTIFNAIDFQRRADRPALPVNAPVEALNRLTVFLCPSDPESSSNARNSYRANLGLTAFPRDPNFPRDPPLEAMGAFYPVNRDLSPSNFPDGLSATVCFSERLVGNRNTIRYEPSSDVFIPAPINAFNAMLNSPNSELLYRITCSSLQNPNPPFDNTSGEYWYYAGLMDTWYSHVFTPNSSIPDCGQITGISGSGIITARSAHSVGVNCLFMDGHVELFSSSTDTRVWHRIGTRDGFEIRE